MTDLEMLHLAAKAIDLEIMCWDAERGAKPVSRRSISSRPRVADRGRISAGASAGKACCPAGGEKSKRRKVMGEKLNCRPGDLAVLIKSKLGQEGVVLKCERLLRDGDIVGGVRFSVTNNAPPIWIVDRVLRVQKKEGGSIVGLMVCYDDILRPIRDQPGDDETLAWAGKPNHHESPIALAVLSLEILDSLHKVPA